MYIRSRLDRLKTRRLLWVYDQRDRDLLDRLLNLSRSNKMLFQFADANIAGMQFYPREIRDDRNRQKIQFPYRISLWFRLDFALCVN